jgi:hypothetical protein
MLLGRIFCWTGKDFAAGSNYWTGENLLPKCKPRYKLPLSILPYKITAEDEAFYKVERSLPHRGMEWRTIAQGQRYVDSILNNDFWKAKYPEIKKVTLIDGAGKRAWAISDGRKRKRIIEVGAGHHCELSMLHELAHFADDHKGHGKSFVKILEELIKTFICSEWSLQAVALPTDIPGPVHNDTLSNDGITPA